MQVKVHIMPKLWMRAVVGEKTIISHYEETSSLNYVEPC